MGGELALRGTIWLGVLAWVTAEWRRSAARAPATAGRFAWTVGAVAAVIHSAVAFHLRHEWSHAAAYLDTARQTAAVIGLNWGGGIFVNYAFLAVWTADVLWWWAAPRRFHHRPRILDAAVRAFLWFMFLNGTVVFAPGRMRWMGAAAVLAVAVAWCRTAAQALRP
jgi:hypothetical protein